MPELMERIGTVDTIDGLLANLYSMQREKIGPEHIGFTELTICNTLHAMQRDQKYHEVLQYLDFCSSSGNSWSNALERYFFIGGVWSSIQRQGRFGNLLYMTEEESRSILSKIQNEYGEDTITFLHELASA